MSWSLSAVGANADEAKSNLAANNESHGGHMPKEVGDLVDKAIDSLPAAPKGYGTISVSTYGHFDAESHTTSDLQISVQQVADVGDQAKAA